MTFEHPKRCTVELSRILSNSYSGLYEEFLGSKGSCICLSYFGIYLQIYTFTAES